MSLNSPLSPGKLSRTPSSLHSPTSLSRQPSSLRIQQDGSGSGSALTIGDESGSTGLSRRPSRRTPQNKKTNEDEINVAVIHGDVDVDEEGMLFEVSTMLPASSDAKKKLQQRMQHEEVHPIVEVDSDSCSSSSSASSAVGASASPEDAAAAAASGVYDGSANASGSMRSVKKEVAAFLHVLEDEGFSTSSGAGLQWCCSRGSQCDLLGFGRARRRSSFDGVVSTKRAARPVIKTVSVYAQANAIISGPLSHGGNGDTTETPVEEHCANDEVHCVPPGDWYARQTQLLARDDETDDSDEDRPQRVSPPPLQQQQQQQQQQHDDHDETASYDTQSAESAAAPAASSSAGSPAAREYLKKQQRQQQQQQQQQRQQGSGKAVVETLPPVHRHHQPHEGPIRRLHANAYSSGLSAPQLKQVLGGGGSPHTDGEQQHPRPETPTLHQQLTLSPPSPSSPSPQATTSALRTRVRDKVTMTDVRCIHNRTTFRDRNSPSSAAAEDTAAEKIQKQMELMKKQQEAEEEEEAKRRGKQEEEEAMAKSQKQQQRKRGGGGRGYGGRGATRTPATASKPPKDPFAASQASVGSASSSRVKLGSRFTLAPPLKRTASGARNGSTSSPSATSAFATSASASASASAPLKHDAAAAAAATDQHAGMLAIEYYEGIGVILRPLVPKQPQHELSMSRSEASPPSSSSAATAASPASGLNNSRSTHAYSFPTEESDVGGKARRGANASASPPAIGSSSSSGSPTLPPVTKDETQAFTPPSPKRKSNRPHSPSSRHGSLQQQHHHHALPSVSRPYEVDARSLPRTLLEDGQPRIISANAFAAGGRPDEELLRQQQELSTSPARSLTRSVGLVSRHRRQDNEQQQQQQQQQQQASPTEKSVHDLDFESPSAVQVTVQEPSPKLSINKKPTASTTLSHKSSGGLAGFTPLGSTVLAEPTTTTATRRSTNTLSARIRSNAGGGGGGALSALGSASAASARKSSVIHGKQYTTAAKLRVEREKALAQQAEFERLFPDWPSPPEKDKLAKKSTATATASARKRRK